MSIENVAGCQPGEFTGVFTFNTGNVKPVVSLATLRSITAANESWHQPGYGPGGFPMYATPADVDAHTPGYSSIFVSTQWTPWADPTPSAVSGSDCLWFMYRTGYERLQLQTLMVPTYGTYEVRGIGFITYNGQKYHSGDSVTFVPAHGLNYSVSDIGMKLVTVTTIACGSLLFDHFQGIAPVKNLGESELEDGVQYRVHTGKGISYQRKTVGGFATTTVLPGQLFTWYQGDNTITYDPTGTIASQIRAVEGIKRKDQVPKRGWSNEWCMFISLNHYHWSDSWFIGWTYH
jgi:hypothetical protein